ncbi:helix-turn-helix transcriptional regulator [Paracoccus sp. S1E-3]|uniref:ArsR/SmtB family transcription factor n=1 Tax=Paracoccus sp. S1E-3 TaxID=2756130 RepID=UPI0015EEB022|nr:winged helix-turn-helix domain-containing protein [Paracoccus sp. S1E-3]MBA4491429.1 winged helix-turn-helix transcriptional regulator [Paracoccus sp. S1E-3]
MKDGPDIARIAALIGDPARANMLMALMEGGALTATELAQIAGVTPQTASAHQARLAEGGLIRQRKQGRHRYAELASPQVAAVLQALMGLAAASGHLRQRPGPRDADLRRARICYDHLAGEMGTQMFDALLARGHLIRRDEELDLSEEGAAFAREFLGSDPEPQSRAPLCRECLDWSERRSHLAGRLGRAMLARMIALGWARRVEDSRVICFTGEGERQFQALFSS